MRESILTPTIPSSVIRRLRRSVEVCLTKAAFSNSSNPGVRTNSVKVIIHRVHDRVLREVLSLFKTVRGRAIGLSQSQTTIMMSEHSSMRTNDIAF